MKYGSLLLLFFSLNAFAQDIPEATERRNSCAENKARPCDEGAMTSSDNPSIDNDPEGQPPATPAIDVVLQRSTTESHQVGGALVEDRELPHAPDVSAVTMLIPIRSGMQWQLTAPNQPKTPAVRIEPYWDKRTIFAFAFLASSEIFDSELTHEGIAHHKCVERNSALPAKPSRGDLYLDNGLFQFAPAVAMNWMLALAQRNGHVNTRYWKAVRFVLPTTLGAYHIKGGADWLAQCW